MKLYTYDYNGLFVGTTVADHCPITELKKAEQHGRKLKKGEHLVQTVYIKPAFSTEIAPPETKPGFNAVFNGKAWDIVKIPEPKVIEPEIIVLSYSEKRAAEYPSFLEYLDGIVKGDEKQVSKYINDCLKVKKKYPKD